MSYPPPPPGSPPPPQYPPGGAGPAPVPASSAGSGKAFLVLAAVLGVLFVLGAGFVVVTRLGGGGSVDGDGAAASLATFVSDAPFDESGAAELDVCPFGDEEATLGAAGDLEELGGALDAGRQLVVESGEGYGAGVICTFVDDAEAPTQGVYVYAQQAPAGAYADALDTFIEASYGDRPVTREDVGSSKGGDVHTYCVQADDANGLPAACTSEWVSEDDDVVLGISVEGASATAERSRGALDDLVSDMASDLADAEPDFSG